MEKTQTKISTTSATVISELQTCLGAINDHAVDDALELIDNAQRIFCAGAGRSGLGIRGFAMRLMHLGKTAFVMGEITTPAIQAGDVFVIGSGSGRTPSLVAAAEKAKKLGVKIVLFTIDPQSPIGQLADVCVKFPAPSEKAAGGGTAVSIQPMGSLFEQSLFLLFDCLIVHLMKRHDQSSADMFTNHANLE
ncbi:MAG: 6-phospho-3-hexuloisomerase [Planctomycetes bacterium]|nr:6-phospho-3-hexuloisomerase [Planctomycetota bacterium]